MLVVKVWARAMTVEAPFGLAAERPVAPAAPDSWRGRLERLMRTPLRQLPVPVDAARRRVAPR